MLQVNNRSKGTSGATWVDSKQTMHKKMTEHIFSYEEMIELLCFVIDNSFVSNGKTINIQTCGVPMGTNSAPDLANLYLYSYESDFIEALALTDEYAARQFHLTFRLIDDLYQDISFPHSRFLNRRS